MTTIYVPKLIESIEQAEALPRRALVFNNDTDEWIQPLIKVGHADDDWSWMGDDEWEPRPDDLIGWTALVPVKVKEWHDEGTGWLVPGYLGPLLRRPYLGSPDGTPPQAYEMTTWRTPWETSSPSPDRRGDCA